MRTRPHAPAKNEVKINPQEKNEERLEDSIFDRYMSVENKTENYIIDGKDISTN